MKTTKILQTDSDFVGKKNTVLLGIYFCFRTFKDRGKKIMKNI